MNADTITKLSLEAWLAEGVRRFGEDYETWRFVCPSCGNVARMGEYKEFKEQGATPDSATSECIGRYRGAKGAFDPKRYKPCNYAGYGLFRISPVRVIQADGHETHSFGFAD